MSSYYCVCPHTAMCPHTTYYICVLILPCLPECEKRVVFAFACASLIAHTNTTHLSIGRQSADIVHLKLLALYPRPRQHTSAYVSIHQRTSAYVSMRQHNQDCRKTNIRILLLCRSDFVVHCFFTSSKRRVQRGWEGVGLDMWQQELGWWGLCTVFGKVLPSPGRMVCTSTPIVALRAQMESAKRDSSFGDPRYVELQKMEPWLREKLDNIGCDGEVCIYIYLYTGVCDVYIYYNV